MENGNDVGSVEPGTGGTEPNADAPEPTPTGRSFPSSNIGRPRIQGVEAGVAAGLVPPTPATPERPTTGHAPRHLSKEASQPYSDEEVPREISEGVELPDWTDPPTHEVPRVLLGPGTEQSSGIPGPVWRESERDFDEDREAFAEIVSESVAVIAHEEGAAYDDGFGFEGFDDAIDAGGDWPPAAEESDEDQGDYGPRPGVRFAGRMVKIGVAQTAGPPISRAPAPAREPRERRPGAGRDMVVATVTGAAIGGLALLCCLIGPAAVLALASLVLLLAAAEFFQTLRRARFEPATLLGLLAAPGFAIAAYLKGTDAIPLMFALAVVGVLVWYLAGVSRGNVVQNASVSLLGIAWIAGLGAFAGLLLDPTAFPAHHGVAYLLGAIEATVAYDVGGLAFGSTFGRRKLAPHVSPNKTWEGLLGGSLTAILAAVLITSRMYPWSVSRALVLGVIVAVVAPVGDLVESLVKRDLNVKDMGTLLPEHGGILDRVDALLFVLPATYFLVRLFHG